MLYIDSDQITKHLDFNGIMDSIEKAYKIYENEDFEMPDRIHVGHGENTLLYMPCFSKDVFGTKMISVFPGNTAKGKPAIEGLMVLNSADDGRVLSIIDGAALTAVRTGGVGGCAVRRLARKDAKSVGIIGAGTQAFYQILFACSCRNIEKVRVYSRTAERSISLCERLKAELGDVDIMPAERAEDLVRECDIVITATTSENPVIPNGRELLKGKLFVAIGSYKPNMRELPDELFSLVGDVYVDTEFAAQESGDIKIPLEKGILKNESLKTFSKVVTGKSAPRGDTLLFKSVGMALFDLVVAGEIYKSALESGRGVKL